MGEFGGTMSAILKLIITASIFFVSTVFAAVPEQPSATAASNSTKPKPAIEIKLNEKPALETLSADKLSSSNLSSDNLSKPAQISQNQQESIKPIITPAASEITQTTKAPSLEDKTTVNQSANQNVKQDVKQPEKVAEASDLKVLEFVLANQVIEREPKDVVEKFAQGSEKAFAFARLNANVASEVTFVWYRNNQVYTQYTAPIQAAKTWRTYSSIKLKSGDWKVQLLGKNKEVLAEKTFTIQ